MLKTLYRATALFGLCAFAALNMGMAYPCLYDRSNFTSFATNYTPLATGRQVTHQCQAGERAAYLVPGAQGGYDLCNKDAGTLAQAHEVFLTCLPGNLPKPQTVKLLQHARGGKGFKVAAGAHSITNFLTLEAL